MKLTKSKLKEIIREEIQNLNERKHINTVRDFYNDFEYELTVIERDKTGRNDTYEIEWVDEMPKDVDVAEEEIINAYYAEKIK